MNYSQNLIHSLLTEALQLHDAEVREVVASEDGAGFNVRKNSQLFSKELLRSLLITLTRTPNRDLQILCAFTLDNVVQASIFDTHGTDELHAQDEIILDQIKQDKNQLAREMGFENYYELYLFTRGYDSVRIKEQVAEVLRETKAKYLDGLNIISHKDQIGREEFDLQYRKTLHHRLDQFPPERILPLLTAHLNSLFDPGICARVSLEPATTETISFSYTLLEDPRSVVVVPLIGGFEQYRAAFHALGHSLFALLNVDERWFGLPIDVARTESLAFLFQEIVSNPRWLRENSIDVEDSFPKAMEFYDLYFERLYAVRTIFERQYYQQDLRPDVAAKLYTDLIRQYLRIEETNKQSFAIDYRPTGVEFSYAFKELAQTRTEIPAHLANHSTGRLLAQRYQNANKVVVQ